MALADFYARGALAASQVLAGFDEQAFAAKLGATPVGLAFDAETVASGEGAALIDMLVGLLARLYPTLAIDPAHATAIDLARQVNPGIDIAAPDRATIGVAVGPTDRRFTTTVFAGSDGWDALIDDTRPQAVGASANPMGAGAAACLAAGAIFRVVFGEGSVDSALRLSAWLGDSGAAPDEAPAENWQIGEVVLVGAGAIGNGAVWALSRAPARGHVHIVDDEPIDLGNLQRYVLAMRGDEHAVKADLAAAQFTGDALTATPHPQSWGAFVTEHGYRWQQALLALDSAQARRDVQGSLPRHIVNAWTQPGDLGVSNHSAFGGQGACVACLYLPDAAAQNEDELVAGALAIPHRLQEVRTLLHTGAGVDPGLLADVAAGLGQPVEEVMRFAGQPVRDLYVRGVCGGALLPLGRAGRPDDAVHVPLAHQSALAGVLLAAAAVRQAVESPPKVTRVTRLNVLRPVGVSLNQPARRRGDGRCLCEDPDFLAAYQAKWPAG
jgi:hypothetical protein